MGQTSQKRRTVLRFFVNRVGVLTDVAPAAATHGDVISPIQ